MNLVYALLLAVASMGSGRDAILEETVDVAEHNHFFDDQGRHVFDQVIFYDWCPIHNRHQVRAWRLVKDPSQIPQRDWQDGGYFVLWYDQDVLRRVQAKSYRESWGQVDPELLEREWLPKELRKGLRPAAGKPARP